MATEEKVPHPVLGPGSSRPGLGNAIKGVLSKVPLMSLPPLLEVLLALLRALSRRYWLLVGSGGVPSPRSTMLLSDDEGDRAEAGSRELPSPRRLLVKLAGGSKAEAKETPAVGSANEVKAAGDMGPSEKDVLGERWYLSEGGTAIVSAAGCGRRGVLGSEHGWRWKGVQRTVERVDELKLSRSQSERSSLVLRCLHLAPSPPPTQPRPDATPRS